jgi:hypothetical protein
MPNTLFVSLLFGPSAQAELKSHWSPLHLTQKMANDPTRFSVGNGRTGNSANYHFSSNVIATEPATKSTSLYALVPGKPRERGMRSSAPDVNLHRSTLSLSDMSDELGTFLSRSSSLPPARLLLP